MLELGENEYIRMICHMTTEDTGSVMEEAEVFEDKNVLGLRKFSLLKLFI
jgi:hypothetical protein